MTSTLKASDPLIPYMKHGKKKIPWQEAKGYFLRLKFMSTIRGYCTSRSCVGNDRPTPDAFLITMAMLMLTIILQGICASHPVGC